MKQLKNTLILWSGLENLADLEKLKKIITKCFDGGNEVFVADKEKVIKGKRKSSPSGFAVKVERKYE